MSDIRIDTPSGPLIGVRDGAGPPALVLHGGPGLSDYTEGLADELAPLFGTIRYQQRGLAPSAVEGPITVDQHVADALAIIDALGIAQAWLVGHSWGGYLAMHVAVARPSAVLGLVIIDTLGAVGDGGYAALGQALNARYAAFHGRPLADNAALADIWPFYFATPDGAPAMPPIRMRENNAETWASIRAHVADHALELRLPKIDAPTIFVHGVEDPLPASASVDSAALMRRAEVDLIENCGHFPWIEQPGRVRAAASRVAEMARS
jgi:proline iminopeptidase